MAKKVNKTENLIVLHKIKIYNKWSLNEVRVNITEKWSQRKNKLSRDEIGRLSLRPRDVQNGFQL